eukprot:scaffold575633_cov23-Prasinocladus_malaysianus.AAC.1
MGRSAKCQTVPLVRYSVDGDHEHVWRRKLRYDSVPAYHDACELTDAPELGYEARTGTRTVAAWPAAGLLVV